MTAIYEQFDKSFKNVAAYIVLDKQGEFVAKIAIKFPADGAGRLYAYVHWMGTEMTRGQASGYGYDKRSAAVADAINKIRKRASYEAEIREHAARNMATFTHALKTDGGEYFDTRLRNAGFTVIQAV